MGNRSNIEFLEHIQERQQRRQQPSYTGRLAQLEHGFQALTLALADANKTIGVQRAEIRELQRDMNELLTKDMTIDCAICGHTIENCNCGEKLFS